MARRLTPVERETLAEFADEFRYCWACGRRASDSWKLDIAHILGGANRHHDRRNLSLLCHVTCHQANNRTGHTVNGIAWPALPTEALLWLKAQRDPLFFDPEWILKTWRSLDQSGREGAVLPLERPHAAYRKAWQASMGASTKLRSHGF